jgi:hypothetical protein
MRWLFWPALAGVFGFTVVRVAPRSYEVQLAAGFVGTDDCAARADKAGYDSLTGIVRGMEPDGKSDDDVLYQGVLRRVTKLDICGDPIKSRTGEFVPCVAKLTGEAQMSVDVRVDGDEGRGAWVNAKGVPGSVKVLKVEGDCTPHEMEQLKKEYPGGESAGSPDGQSIPESSPPKFFVAGVPRLRVGYFPTEPDHPAWSLRVVRVVP